MEMTKMFFKSDLETKWGESIKKKFAARCLTTALQNVWSDKGNGLLYTDFKAV